MKLYELCWAIDGGNLFATFYHKEDAEKLFKHIRKRPENPVRSRVYEDGKVICEKKFGQHNWDIYDDDMRERWYVNSQDTLCFVVKVDVVTLDEDIIETFPNRNSALKWIAHETITDPKYGKDYIYIC